MRATVLGLTLLALAFGTCSPRLHAEEKPEADANAPQSVKDALKALVPEGELKSVKREQKGKLRRYSAEVQDKDGLVHKFLVRVDGSVIERTDPLKVEAIPAGITTALKTKFPKGKATAATKFTIRGKTTYEVEYESDGAKSKAYFGEDGSEAQAPAAAKDDDEDK